VKRALFLAAVWLYALSTATASEAAAESADVAAAWRRFSDQPAAPPAIPIPFESCFEDAAADQGLPVALLVAVARGESNFDPDAVSSANARGLMQIQWPETGRHLGFRQVTELHQPCRNVDAGARYLKELLGRYGGDLHMALAAYNYGPGRIRAGGDLPAGAVWYSGYIYRHLQYVLGAGGAEPPAREWVGDRQLELAIFRAPYRAEAFVETLQQRMPDIRLDWFRQDVARFRVVLLYASRAEREAGIRRLAAAGFMMTGVEANG
jgi:hypothetical protein